MAKSSAKSNKLSIRLLAEECHLLGKNPELDDIGDNRFSSKVLKKPERVKKEWIEIGKEKIGVLFYDDSHNKEPPWVNNFFLEYFNNEDENSRWKIFSSSAKALFITFVSGRFFAISFGHGHTMLQDVSENRFGLKVVLNSIGESGVKSLGKKNFSTITKIVQEQLINAGRFDDFGINVEYDLLNEVVGVSDKNELPCKNERKVLTGKDALSLSYKANVGNIQELLREIFVQYKNDSYKQRFGWIDHITAQSDQKAKELDKKLNEWIKDGRIANMWMAVPEPIKWEDIEGFYCGRELLGDDINLDRFLKAIRPKLGFDDVVTVDYFKQSRIAIRSASNQNNPKSWKAYNCLYCELEEDGETFILSDGKWYEIKKNFVRQINENFSEMSEKLISTEELGIPDCRCGEKELAYNERASNESNGGILLLDRRLIRGGGARSQIEFCDLLTSNRKIIHVKKYGSSSVLSHLFAQGLTSATLLKLEENFRSNLNDKLLTEAIYQVPKKFESSEYTIVFAIISNSEKKLTIPFFSRVNFDNTQKMLKAFGYKVRLAKIQEEREVQAA